MDILRDLIRKVIFGAKGTAGVYGAVASLSFEIYDTLLLSASTFSESSSMAT